MKNKIKKWKQLLAVILLVVMCVGVFPVQAQAAEDYRTWAQADERWGSIELGTSGKTVKSSGCLVTAITKLIIQCGLKDADSFTPATLVNWLNKNDGFSGASLVWAKPASYVDGLSLYSHNVLESGTYSIAAYTDDIIEWIEEGLHLVLQVKDGGHWVAVDEAMTLTHGEIYIMDSLTGNPNADIRLEDRYSNFNRVAAYTGGTTPEIEDEPTTEEPDEPTTEEPDEPTTEEPDEPTTEEPDEPTTEEPDDNDNTITDDELDKYPGDDVENVVPDNTLKNPFVDVSEDSYYHDAVLWAYENDITTGTDETHFSPDDSCSRAQIVTFLWRANGCPKPEMTESPFSDVAEEDSYYYQAVLWALENDITTGTDESHFQPETVCTREQIVTFLWRANGCPKPKVTENPFEDIVDENAYYYDAVLWAYENDITTGTDETHFSPKEYCTRGQVVTFLYRNLQNE